MYMTYMVIKLPQTPRFNGKFLFTLKSGIFGVIYSYLISKRPMRGLLNIQLLQVSLTVLTASEFIFPGNIH